MVEAWRDSKPLGAAAEMYVAHELMVLGFGVSLPLGDNEPYDLIACHKSKLSRLQVKATRCPQHGTYRVNFRHGNKGKRPYTEDDCDFIVAVVYYPSGPALHVIPAVDITTAKGIFWEVGKHPRYPDKWIRCKWQAYRNAWEPLY